MTFTAEKRHLFAATVLLGHMAERDRTFDVLLLGSQAHLQELLNWLMVRKLVEIDDRSHHYTLTAQGKEKVRLFTLRYQKLLTYFDVFSAVDLEEGEFALASFSRFKTGTSWQDFLDHDRWEDLRIPVAIELSADPLELIFAHFMQEGRFDFDTAAWELTLAEGLVWQEMEEILQHSVTAGDLSYDDVSGSSVLRDVIEHGFILVRELCDEDPEILAHLARWSPLHDGDSVPADSSSKPFWQEPWQLPLPD